MAQLLLTGTYQRSLDAKNRVAMPRPLRDALARRAEFQLYIAPGTDDSLHIYRDDVFEELGKAIESRGLNDRSARTFSRLFYAQAQALEIDEQGRIRIPTELREFARLENEIFLLGVRDHLEIWSGSAWQAYLTEHRGQFDRLAEQVFEAQNKNANP